MQNTLPSRVLVVDDNRANQAVLQGQLERLGCLVSVADDGAQALALWDIRPYDLVLTDISMPYLDGYGLAQRLRQEGATVPIIGVTANAMPDEAQRCLAAGMDAWIVKPITLGMLTRLLHQHLPPGQAPAAPEPAAARPGPACGAAQPNVLDAHRRLFIDTMTADISMAQQALDAGRAWALADALHRMRGALALARQGTLVEQLAALEDRLRKQGMDAPGEGEASAALAWLRRLISGLEAQAGDGKLHEDE